MERDSGAQKALAEPNGPRGASPPLPRRPLPQVAFIRLMERGQRTEPERGRSQQEQTREGEGQSGNGSPPAATERLSALIQNAGAALTIALALLFSFIVALVALAGAEGEGRVTVATAAFSAIGTIAGTYSGLRLGAHGKEQAERGRDEAEQARQESELAAERVAHGKEHAERGRDEAERARQESELVVEQVATKVGEDPVKQARGEVAHRRSGGQSGPIASSGPLQGGL